MASNEDFNSEWSMLCQECTTCWSEQDLQLAAELGKTLLERNKELENCIKLHQCTIDDQAQEIEYMKKQTAALREVNDSRLKIYEQLEVSIQDLERANHRLALENANDKKQIKSQCLTIDTLEARVDDTQKKFDELNKRYETLLRDHQTRNDLTGSRSSDATSTANHVRTAPLRDGSTQHMAVSPRRASPDLQDAHIHQLATTMASDEDVTKLLQQLQESRSQRAREQKKVNELKEQLDAILQEHAHMEEQLNHWKSKAENMKNLQDELNTLEEVRQGHLCGRCLRGTDPHTQDELSVMLDEEEDDEISLSESFAESLRDVDTTLQELGSKVELVEEENCNPYRVLVEKYEALLKVQQRRKPNVIINNSSNGNSNGVVSAPVTEPIAPAPSGCLSLQEELQMSGEFSAFNSGQSEAESGNGRDSAARLRGRKSRKPFAGTPTDFSEAETSSSGFSDETSNKATQTEGRPGSFLCTIADGEDCKFSIYDDSSTFDGRFHQTPEYRKLFGEIFEVLKRAAVAKDEGTQLPLLEDDSASNGGLLTPKLEPTSPSGCPSLMMEDGASEATDDARSIVSLAVSEPVFRVRTPILSRRDAATGTGEASSHAQNGARRQPLEYLSVQVRKRGSAKKSSRRPQTNGSTEVASPDVIPTPNPRVVQLKSAGRRRFRPLQPSELSDGYVWNGSTAHFYPSKTTRGRAQHQSPQQQQTPRARDQPAPRLSSGAENEDYKPGTASEEVAKLRRLEMSYAEALRMPNNKTKGARQRKNHH